MDEAMQKARPQGLEAKDFEKATKEAENKVKHRFDKESFFGSDGEQKALWQEISVNLAHLTGKYCEDNDRLREKVLAGFASIALLGAILFLLDYASDFLCDWWSDTCAAGSRLALLVYGSITLYIG